MGRVLSWQPILWIEFPCSQWEVVSWSESASLFVLWGGEVFFQVVFGVKRGLSTVYFSLGQWTVDFQCKVWGGVVSMKFPRGSPSSQCVPQYVSNSTTLLSPMLCPKVLPFLTYIARPMGRHSILQQQTFILGSVQSFSFFFCDGPIKVTLCNQKNQLENTLHLS